MAGGVRYDVPHLRKHQKFFDCCVAAHGVSFTVIDVQTPWPKFEPLSSGETPPILDVIKFLVNICYIRAVSFLSPDRFINGSVNA